jgi:hypothetical protein
MTFGLTNGTTGTGLLGGSGGVTYNDKQIYGTPVKTAGSSDRGVLFSLGVTTDPTKSGIETSDEGLYLYFYVGETVQNANLVNVGRVEEKLSDCITRNDCKAYIVETYKNEDSWYRVWSDGWIEQGGRGEAPNNDTGAQISLLKAMANTSYTVIAVQLNLGGGYNIGVGTLTTASFNIRANSNASVGAVAWYVCGY